MPVAFITQCHRRSGNSEWRSTWRDALASFDAIHAADRSHSAVDFMRCALSTRYEGSEKHSDRNILI